MIIHAAQTLTFIQTKEKMNSYSIADHHGEDIHGVVSCRL
jgi:hypothetical protein